MKIFSTLPSLHHPDLALTIGAFDGVHRGHAALLQRLRQHSHHTACLTFSNHPSTLLQPEHPVSLLCSLTHKKRLLEKQHIEYLFLLPFAKELAQKSAEQFLTEVHHNVPFSALILGHDARLGHRQEGTAERIQPLADSLGFTLEYLPPLTHQGSPISSSRIRTAIEGGNLRQASELLGRDLSFYGTVQKGAGQGGRIGTPTANLDIAGLCIPPFGVYAVTLLLHGIAYTGVANLGVAPTLKKGRAPLLEVHLFTPPSFSLYGQEVEVVLSTFLRPEQCFNSIEALRTQIQCDIAQAKTFFAP